MKSMFFLHTQKGGSKDLKPYISGIGWMLVTDPMWRSGFGKDLLDCF